MSDVTLSKAVRSNLLHLQNTARLMDITQERLATGKKVNSALDNPTNFFTASALNARASDLAQLMDAVGNAIQTIEMADKGISAITKLVESAQSIARQALNSTAPAFTLTGTQSIGADLNAAFSGSTAPAAGMDGESITITDHLGNSGTFSFDSGGGGDFSTIAELETLLRDAGILVSAEDDGTGGLTLTSTRATGTVTVEGALAESLGLIADAGTPETRRPTNPAFATLAGESLSITSDGRTQTLAFGPGGIENRADLVAALNGLSDVNARLVEGKVDITTKGGNPFTLAFSDPEVGDALGIAEGTFEATEPHSKRAELIADYNGLLAQIDELARDAHFNGVNLLGGDALKVIFNEDGSSSLTLEGVNRNASSLGLHEITDPAAWNTNIGVNETLGHLKNAIETLRTDASKFGTHLSIVENRQSFTKEMINVLETGAANLTLADTNEEAANMLALQTRQQLSQTALSLASQADQAVLRLFG